MIVYDVFSPSSVNPDFDYLFCTTDVGKYEFSQLYYWSYFGIEACSLDEFRTKLRKCVENNTIFVIDKIRRCIFWYDDKIKL